MALLPDGDLFVTYRKATHHNPPPASDPGTIVAKRRIDGVWSSEYTLWTPSEGYEARDVSCTTLSDGRVALAFTTYEIGMGSGLGWESFIMYSSDDGATFGSPYQLVSQIAKPAATAPPIELANGDLLIAVYGWLTAGDTDWSIKVLKSTDDGATFADLALVADGPANTRDYVEPNLVLRDDGSILCMIRQDDNSQIARSVSFDSGATWTAPPAVLFPGTGRPAVIQTSSGALVMCYRDGTTGYAQYRTSWNGGISWEPAIVFDEGFRFTYGLFAEVSPNVLALGYSIEESGASVSDFKLTYIYRPGETDPLA